MGVLISILATSSLAWALCAAIVFTFTFNYLFTEPKLTFHMDDVNYVVSSIVFVAAASIVATLVVKLQKQMQIANKKREITARMNEIGSGFLNLSGYQQIKEYSEESLSNLTGKPVTRPVEGGREKGISQLHGGMVLQAVHSLRSWRMPVSG